MYMTIEPINHQDLLGLRVATESRQSILEKIEKGLDLKTDDRGLKTEETSKKHIFPYVITTPNTEQTVEASRNRLFTTILNQSDLALPDGIGIVLASRILKTEDGGQKVERLQTQIPGVEFMQDLVAIAAKKRVRIALIGGAPGVALKALECLKRTYPGLEGWVDEGPGIAVVHERTKNETRSAKHEERTTKQDGSNFEFRISDFNTISPSPDLKQWLARMAQKMLDTGVGMVFVAYGAPKQEYIVDYLRQMIENRSPSYAEATAGRQKTEDGVQKMEYRKQRTETDNQLSVFHPQSSDPHPIILMSVGGSFDMISGRLSRAPQYMRTLGLEWLYRLIQEPWRIKRQFDLVRFILIVLKKRFSQ